MRGFAMCLFCTVFALATIWRTISHACPANPLLLCTLQLLQLAAVTVLPARCRAAAGRRLRVGFTAALNPSRPAGAHMKCFQAKHQVIRNTQFVEIDSIIGQEQQVDSGPFKCRCSCVWCDGHDTIGATQLWYRAAVVDAIATADACWSFACRFCQHTPLMLGFIQLMQLSPQLICCQTHCVLCLRTCFPPADAASADLLLGLVQPTLPQYGEDFEQLDVQVRTPQVYSRLTEFTA
jgi:hypothetical protein